MPSVSKKQRMFMAAVAHSPEFAKKVGVPMSVGKDFNQADKGRKFAKGGEMAESKKMAKKEIAFMERKGAPKSMIKHEKEEYGMKKGGYTKKMADGGPTTMPVRPMPARAMPAQSNMGGASRGLDRAAAMSGRTMPARPATMAKGGLAAGHKTADGIAKKGKTKAMQVTMKRGGKC